VTGGRIQERWATQAGRSRGSSVNGAPSQVASRLARRLGKRDSVLKQLVLDTATLYLASLAALVAAPTRGVRASYWIAATFPLVTLAILYRRSIHRRRLSNSTLDATAQVIVAVSGSAILMLAAAAILGEDHLTRLVLRLWLLSLALLELLRISLLFLRRRALQRGALAIATLVVGAGLVGRQLVARLGSDPRYGLRPVGFLDSDPLPWPGGTRSALVPVIGEVGDLLDAIARTQARRVILAFSTEPDRVLVELARECQQLGVEVSLVPRLFESINSRATLDHVGGLPIVSLCPTDPSGWEFTLKHALDRGVAFVALLMLSPLMLLLAIAVRVSSPGPVLFRQLRVGRDGRVFDLLKFRTMSVGQEPDRFQPAAGLAPGGIEGEDRCTRLGYWLRSASLDELPQLLNVLRGEMSLVGPRPERPEFVERFATEVGHYQDRHRVKSGITGWAQVHGLRGQTSIADRVEWDNYYVRNWSLRLDLRIIALTIAEILRFRG
jgi:exopolysaccharide biosynthesis polyprenyl glycosylphosphotransferase